MTGKLQKRIAPHLEAIRHELWNASPQELETLEIELQKAQLGPGSFYWLFVWFAPALDRLLEDARRDRKRFGLARLRAMAKEKQ